MARGHRAGRRGTRQRVRLARAAVAVGLGLSALGALTIPAAAAPAATLAAPALAAPALVAPVPVAPPPGTTNTAPTGPAGGEQLSAEELGLEAFIGFEGTSAVNSWMPVTVRLTPRRLFSGTIRVTTDRNITESREVEVAGAATKEFTFLMPSSSLTVQVQPAGDSRAVQVRPRVNGNPGGALVGISPALLAAGDGGRALPDVELDATDERVIWVTADPLLLERSHLALTSLGTMVLATEDLDALSDLGRGNLQRAVLDGLSLVVVGRSGPLDTGLPWAPATAVTPGSGDTLATVTAAPGVWTLSAAQAFGTATANDAPTTLPTADPTTDEGTTGGTTGDATTPAPNTTGDGDAAVTPASLQATATDEPVAATQLAGLGRVVFTGLSPAAGGTQASSDVWRHLLAERDASLRLNGQHTSERGWVAQEALRSGGVLDIPSLGLLALFAIGYVLVIGPVNAFFVKKMGRRELGWITVPVITVGFVLIAALVASGTQPRVGVAGSAATWVDGLGQEVVVAAVRAPSAGDHEIVLPGPDWQLDPTTADFSGLGVTIDRSTGDVAASIALQSLQVGTVVAIRPIQEAAPLAVTATLAADGVLRVEVTNVSTRAITDIQVRAGGEHHDLGDLAPGESTEWVGNPGAQLRQLDVYRDVFQESRKNDGTMEAPRSFRALISGGALADRPGSVVVVGDDADAPTQLLADGAEVESLGRSVAVTVSIEGNGNVRPVEVSRTLLVGSFQDAWQPSPHAVEGELSAVLRFRLPDRAAGRVQGVLPDVLRGEGFIEGRQFDQPFPVPDFEAGGCLNLEERFPDGSVSGSTTCDDGLAIPPCPPDATVCESGPDFWHFEFEDGRVQDGTLTSDGGGQIFPGEPGRNQVGGAEFQVYDHGTRSWAQLDDTMAANDGGLPPRFVSALGEVHLRIQGGLFPFDYSARGVGATLTGAEA